MHENDVLISKFSIIRNCLRTIKNVTENNTDSLNDYITQDVFVLNLQRAIQACIDIANVIISKKSLQIPSSYKQLFWVLEKHKIISSNICYKLTKMIGFRNIAVHDYQEINPEILKSILVNNLGDFEDYIEEINNQIREDL